VFGSVRAVRRSLEDVPACFNFRNLSVKVSMQLFGDSNGLFVPTALQVGNPSEAQQLPSLEAVLREESSRVLAQCRPRPTRPTSPEAA